MAMLQAAIPDQTGFKSSLVDAFNGIFGSIEKYGVFPAQMLADVFKTASQQISGCIDVIGFAARAYFSNRLSKFQRVGCYGGMFRLGEVYASGKQGVIRIAVLEQGEKHLLVLLVLQQINQQPRQHGPAQPDVDGAAKLIGYSFHVVTNLVQAGPITLNYRQWVLVFHLSSLELFTVSSIC
ncbi:hypothetical protein [Anderseniella sp. Alg231-50]|uniref:hypothetical protein n=1 Tax=Anderseniella sp. Alg231-50 TaxID=1922226 RepID=UPI00307CAC16